LIESSATTRTFGRTEPINVVLRFEPETG
jgi:hypothetical protein